MWPSTSDPTGSYDNLINLRRFLRSHQRELIKPSYEVPFHVIGKWDKLFTLHRSDVITTGQTTGNISQRKRLKHDYPCSHRQVIFPLCPPPTPLQTEPSQRVRSGFHLINLTPAQFKCGYLGPFIANIKNDRMKSGWRLAIK